MHFAPFVLFMVLSIFFLHSLQNEWEIIVLGPKLVSLTAYPIYVLTILPSKGNTKLINVYNVTWIKVIALLFLLSIGISILRMILELSLGISYFRFWDTTRYVALVIIIGFFGVRYGTLYQTLSPRQSKNTVKYKTSPLREDDIEKIRIEIERIFETDKPYLNPDFSLEELANLLSIAKHHLSQILNSEMNTNFYNLVNQRRIEHSLEQIKQYSKLGLTLEGIGYECGFNSKSSFFHNFKKIVGLTPREYFKKISTA
ncbi:helix-turn-helix domain-containing protein [uncultured Croceitalea sp.]|uniref:helix-turn-helix domain-containing protein n=1 Tax=uncultured Croceitalea sp. TaxID=1798908 RepID=UPI0033057048